MNLDAGTIYSFKLVNGDEIIGTFAGTEGDYAILDKPLILVLTNEGPRMAPIILTSEQEKLPVNPANVITWATTKSDACDHYKQVTTGIMTPSKQIITG